MIRCCVLSGSRKNALGKNAPRKNLPQKIVPWKIAPQENWPTMKFFVDFFLSLIFSFMEIFVCK